ncbi:MAG: peptidase family M1-domain-containing protein [Piptocephalis tieghemiana]|nr:MAG: peptidase family M1-domain-containing protein [Piptocephalis tieghemiana]
MASLASALSTSSVDPATYANVDEVQTRHLHLDLKVDFAQKALSGSVRLQLQALKTPVRQVTLDTRALLVDRVEVQGKECPFKLHEPSKAFGSALNIPLVQPLTKEGEEVEVVVHYQTTEASPAIQWLDPAQTVGKAHPYLFTQCQAIHARSLVPCQDSPAVKLTYSASITAPSPLRVLMSALGKGSGPAKSGPEGWVTYHFDQATRMPSYLIAMVVGNLEGREVGPRTTVWSEPEVVAEAEWEFQETEKFLATGESLLTPYEWGRYDLLVLPGSFPYGGMENPCLTFVTPTLLAGDRTLVDVVAHEIAHSWTGNLVTTQNWEHFWLNEGWTVFVERKIMGRLHGEPERQFSAILGLSALRESVQHFGPTNPLTALVPDLHGMDPDDAFSSIPYEKGFHLLYYLETLLGGPKVFEPYMRAHVQEFQGKSIQTSQWKDFLYQYFASVEGGKEKVALLDQVDWATWLKAPGMPPVENKFDPTLAEKATTLAKRWEKEGQEALDFSSKDLDEFNSNQKVLFLDHLSSQEKPMPHAKLALMEELYQLTSVRNCEVRFAWQMLGLKASYDPIYGPVQKFLGEQGRMKYVRPLYRALNQCDPSLAKEIFKENRSSYHPIATRMIEKDLGL